MFIAKKLISQLVTPFPVCMALIAVGSLLILRGKTKNGKYVFFSGALTLLALCLPPIPNWSLAVLEEQYGPAYDKAIGGLDTSYPYIAVLGGGLVRNRSLPPIATLSRGSAVRILEAVRLYRKLPGSKLIILGGPVSSTMADSTVMAQAALELGVAPEDVILFDDAKDTISQARRLRGYLGDQSFLLVTSAFHMPRAMAMSTHLGLQATAAPADYLRSESNPYRLGSLIPSVTNLQKAHIAWHECLGIAWARMRGQV